MTETITVRGNIATDPTYKTTPTGVQILSFRLASTKRRFDDESKTWVDGDTNWFTISLFNKLAVNASASLHKGERVIVTGGLRLRSWEVEGRPGFTAEINADAVGHDLRFGTTAFTKSGGRREPEQVRGAGSPSIDEQSSDAWAAKGESATWSSPMQESGDPASTSDRVPVAAGQHSLPDETPF